MDEAALGQVHQPALRVGGQRVGEARGDVVLGQQLGRAGRLARHPAVTTTTRRPSASHPRTSSTALSVSPR